jgi:hypothetical protein
MPAPGTQFAGPIISGPNQYAGTNPPDSGLCVLTQKVTITQNGANNVSATMRIPEHCQIMDFLIDRTVAFDSATTAGLTIGTAALGAQYATSIDVKAAAGRTIGPVAPTLAQMTALLDTGTNKDVVCTVAVVGATTAGSVTITMRYVQTVNWQS